MQPRAQLIKDTRANCEKTIRCAVTKTRKFTPPHAFFLLFFLVMSGFFLIFAPPRILIFVEFLSLCAGRNGSMPFSGAHFFLLGRAIGFPQCRPGAMASLRTSCNAVPARWQAFALPAMPSRRDGEPSRFLQRRPDAVASLRASCNAVPTRWRAFALPATPSRRAHGSRLTP